MKSIKYGFLFYLLATLFILIPETTISGGGIALKELSSRQLAPGVTYKNYLLGNDKLRLAIHAVEIDLKKGGELKIVKAKDCAGELEKLHDMAATFDSLSEYKALAAINGSFWAYLYNYPIGPTIIDGEVVEMNSYKNWPSAFFDDSGKMYIDKFKLNCQIKFKTGKKLNISRVNRRHSPNGIALYNRYGGDSIPYINSYRIERAFRQAIEDSLYCDLTDKEYDTLSFKQFIGIAERDSSDGLALKKILAVYMESPGINKDINLKVLDIKTGVVEMPKNGCVVSFGKDIPDKYLPKKGEVFTLRYSTNIMKKTNFKSALSGAPRLMRNGKSKHESESDGVKSKRFIETEYPRTAIGVSKDKSTIYLMAIEGTNPAKGKKGAHLVNTAYAMRRIGAYDAINLDGGGSSVMVIDGKNVMWESNPLRSRKLPLGLVAAVKKEIYEKFARNRK